MFFDTVKFGLPEQFYNSKKETINPDEMKYDWRTGQNDANSKLFFLMRHGETPSNAEKKIIGCEVDEDLTEKGVSQAASVAKKIADWQANKKINLEKIYSSTLKRAAHTANIISKKIELGVVDQRDNLREINWGDASGMTDQARLKKYGRVEEELMTKYEDLKELWEYLPAIENAEKYNALLKRVVEEMQAIFETDPNTDIALTCHGRLIRTLTAMCINSEDRAKVPYAGNCDVAVFRYTAKSDGSQHNLEFLGMAN